MTLDRLFRRILLTILGESRFLWLICAGLILCVLVSSGTQLRKA